MRNNITLIVLVGLIYWLLVKIVSYIVAIFNIDTLLAGIFVCDILPFVCSNIFIIAIKEIRFFRVIYYLSAIIIYYVIEVIEHMVLYSPTLETFKEAVLIIKIVGKHPLIFFVLGCLVAIQINRMRLKGNEKNNKE